MSISDLNMQPILLDLGYSASTNKTSVIFANVIDQIFFGFGSSIQNGLIDEAKKQNLPKNFKFPYYSLVEKSILDFLGMTDGKKILDEINAEFSRQTKIPGTNEEILFELSKREVLNQLRIDQEQEHIMYFYNNREIRDKTLTHFLESTKSPKIIISSEKISILGRESKPCSKNFNKNDNTLEKDLEVFDKMYEFSSSKLIYSMNWNYEQEINEVQKEYSRFEEPYQIKEKNYLSEIWVHDISKIPDEVTLKLFLEDHPIVILDDPFVIYRKER